MTFANPTALVWGLLAIPVVVLYLLRDRVPHEVTATRFLWDRVIPAAERRSRWRRRRGPVSLAVQLAILGLLVIALAHPQLRAPRRVVLVVDNSGSMNATDAAPSRLAEAKRLAAEQIAVLGDDDRMLALCGTEPLEVACAWTGRKELLREAVEKIPSTKGPTRVDEAVQLARQILGDAPGGEVIVIGDGCDGSTEDGASDGSAEVSWILVGGAGQNRAVTALAPRRSLADPRVCQLFVEVTNYCDQPADCRLQLALNGQTIDRPAIHLPASGVWRRTFQLKRADGGRLTARLEPPDDLDDDDAAAVALPPAPIRRVIAAEGASRYVEQALAANPRVQMVGEKVDRIGDGGRPIRVYCGQTPSRLPAGPAVVLNPQNACDLWELGEPVDDATVARQARGSALLDGIQLEGIQLPGARRLQLRSSVEPASRTLLWAADGTPLGFAIDRAEGRVFVLSGDPESGELVQRAAWPVLLAGALDWVAGDGGGKRGVERGQSHFRSGENWDSPLGVPDPRESCLTAIVQSQPAPRPASAGAPFWMVFAIAALAAVVAEWCLYHRRWTS